MGGAVRYAPSALTGEPFVDLTGVFDDAYVQASSLDQQVTSTGPRVFVLLADLAPYDPEEDENPTVTIGGVRYRVREAQKDGQGGVLLQLQERDE
jgi:hypothetical protein